MSISKYIKFAGSKIKIILIDIAWSNKDLCQIINCNFNVCFCYYIRIEWSLLINWSKSLSGKFLQKKQDKLLKSLNTKYLIYQLFVIILPTYQAWRQKWNLILHLSITLLRLELEKNILFIFYFNALWKNIFTFRYLVNS